MGAHTSTPDKAKHDLFVSSCLVAVIGVVSLFDGCMGIEMYSRIGTLKNEKKDRKTVDESETMFKWSIAVGAVILAGLVALVGYQKGAATTNSTLTKELSTMYGITAAGVVLVVVQTSFGIDTFNKVKQWNSPSKNCDGTENANAKKFAEATVTSMAIFLALSLVFITYFIITNKAFKKAVASAAGRYALTDSQGAYSGSQGRSQGSNNGVGQVGGSGSSLEGGSAVSSFFR
jgi:formate hydrogenlyase subunit 3/multisubunit Na+/H+ antiporter MnhD subunit